MREPYPDPRTEEEGGHEDYGGLARSRVIKPFTTYIGIVTR